VVGVGDAEVGLVETFAQYLGAEPAIGLELAQVVEEAAQGGVGRGAGAIHGGLSGECGAIFGFGQGAAVEAPGGAHDLDGHHFLDGADGVEVFPKGFGELGVFGGLFGPDAVLGREEAELEVIAGGAGLYPREFWGRRNERRSSDWLRFARRMPWWGISFSAPE
jgi:hypothetical protein